MFLPYKQRFLLVVIILTSCLYIFCLIENFYNTITYQYILCYAVNIVIISLKFSSILLWFCFPIYMFSYVSTFPLRSILCDFYLKAILVHFFLYIINPFLPEGASFSTFFTLVPILPLSVLMWNSHLKRMEGFCLLPFF